MANEDINKLIPDSTPFDTRTKQLLSASFPELSAILIDEIEDPNSLELITLPSEFPLVLHKRADFVFQDRNSNQSYHIELQTHAHNDMIYRCFYYSTPITYILKNMPLQYIFHLGSGPANYDTGIFNRRSAFNIDVIDLKMVNAELLINSDTPEIITFAILCAAENKEELTDTILTKLKKLVSNHDRLKDYISILDTLSELRDFKQIVKHKIKEMEPLFNKKGTYLYNEGWVDGKVEGRVEGIEKGIEKERIELIHSMHNLGGLAISEIAKICRLSEDKVKELLNMKTD